MSKHAADPGAAQAHVELRRARVLAQVARALQPAGSGAPQLPEDRVAFLLREAEDLYWNELAWEELTDEELVAGGHLTEMVFPGLLSLVDALLRVQARPHPDAVEAVLCFLGERYAVLSAELGSGADSERKVWARAMTARLIDLVLYRLYRLTPAEREELDGVA